MNGRRFRSAGGDGWRAARESGLRARFKNPTRGCGLQTHLCEPDPGLAREPARDPGLQRRDAGFCGLMNDMDDNCNSL